MVQLNESDPFEEKQFVVTDEDVSQFREKLSVEIDREKREYSGNLPGDILFLG